MVIAIIAITVIISILAFRNDELAKRLIFNAYAIRHHKDWWRFFSYALLHAGWAHLFINMFVLYSFGDAVLEGFELLFGLKAYLYFLMLYIGGVVFSVLFDFGKHKDDPYYSAVGASGAVSAVVFASILIYPTSSLFLFPIPFPIPAVVFGILYLIYSAYMAKRGGDNIGHNAHFWGAIYGLVLTIILKPALFSAFFKEIGNWLGI
jgi:membrane associated rhomboid family serine protease